MSTEPTPPLDRRCHAFRPDLADARLQGRVEAARFVTGQPHRIAGFSAPLRSIPDPASRWDSELLHGERVLVFEKHGGFAWVQNQADGYVGYVAVQDLVPDQPDASDSHLVTAIRAPLFPAPVLKSPIIGWLGIGSRLSATGKQQDRFVELTGGSWVHQRHIAPLGAPFQTDPVESARRFLELPYVWGGRSGNGLDCSALIQLCWLLAGDAGCPRDSDQQRRLLGEALPADTPRQRGDLVFFPGHIGIMLDPVMMIHANATHMAVTINPAEEVAGWTLKSDGAGITGVNRPRA